MPTELRFYELTGTVKKIAHQSCIDAISRGVKKLSGYAWEGVRGGLIPEGGRHGRDNVRKLETAVEPEVPQPRVVGWDADTHMPVIE